MPSFSYFFRACRGVARFMPLFFVVAGLVLGNTAPASALDPLLEQAKNAGQIGETSDGYLAVVSGTSASGDVTARLNDVNNGRRAQYSEIANASGATVDAVAQLSGKKLVESASSGQYVRAGGNWQRVP